MLNLVCKAYIFLHFLKVTSKTLWGGNKSYLWGWVGLWVEIWARGAMVAITGLKREFAFWVKASSPVTSTSEKCRILSKDKMRYFYVLRRNIKEFIIKWLIIIQF